MKTRALGFLSLFCLSILPAAARTIIGVTVANELVHFDSATPGMLSAPVPITGLIAGDAITAIDYRPATGVLYGLAINGATGRIYTIDTSTAVATEVGAAPFSTTLTSSVTGFDFNPNADRIRVTNSHNQNLRVNPSSGALTFVDSELNNPATSNQQVLGLAYDRNDRNPGTGTTLFGIDYFHDLLVRVGGVNGNPSPNSGAVTTIGPTGITSLTSNIGFDIAEDGIAYASMSVNSGGTVYRFYTVNLSTGAVTLVGNIGSGATAIRGIAAVPSRVANIDSGEFFNTIQAAINDAQTLNGHTIVVNAGTFSELVTVNKSVTLLGARAGTDARSSLRGTQETVVRGANSANGRTSAFHITVNNVVIDGFTAQEAANANQFGAGIFMDPNLAGAQIRNNVIQNNIVGLIVSNDTASDPLIVERNLFSNNNVTGPTSGTGIYTDQNFGGPTFTSALIDNNTFENNNNAAILLGATTANSQSNVGITNNIFTGNGNAILLFNLSGSFITANTITGSAGSQMVLGGGINDLDISENIIDGGATRGIRIGDFGGGGTNMNVLIGSNSITNNPTAGLEIDSAANAYTGTLIAMANWWGHASGPTITTNEGGSGQKVIDPLGQIVYRPFLFSGNDVQSSVAGFQGFPAPVLYGINSANNNLVRFSSDTPGTVTSIPITGLIGGDKIIGLDFRPATGELFGLGSGSRLYVINPTTGAATQRGSSGAFGLSGTSFGFDFNPHADSIRVTSDTDQDLRLNPNGSLIANDTALAYASGDPHFGSAVHDVGGAAYLNNFLGTTRTTLYEIDTAQNTLVRQGSFSGTPVSPNSGQLFTIGALGINPTDDATRANTAFDIFSPIPGANLAFATLTTNGTSSSLYRINLVTGEATFAGTIGAGILLRGLTAAPTGQVEFSASSYSVSESGQVATITLNRLRGSEGSAMVQFTTTDGTATTSGSDYTDSSQLISFANGETSKTVAIPINNDSIDEFNETVLLTLSGPFVSSQALATLTIVDDDVVTPTLAVQASASVAVGAPIFNTASISGMGIVALGGTLTFRLFGPNDNCGGAPIFTSNVPVNGSGNYTSGSFTPTAPGAYYWMVNYTTADGTHYASVATPCGGPNQSITATETGLGNIATRLRVETGDNVLIAGFIVTGTEPKKIIVRGIGSSLQLAGKLADPTLELRDSTGALLEADDNWKDSFNKQDIIDSTIPPTDDRESAIVFSLPANASSYTAILRGKNNTTGIGVVEAYDLNRLANSELANISTRGFVSTGDNVLIAGTIVVGKNTRKVIVRAIGPSLNLPNKMANPTLELRDGNGALVEANDNWVDSPNKQAIIDSTIPPTNNLESAIVATLNGNNSAYTAIVRGANGSSGIAVVEIYALP